MHRVEVWVVEVTLPGCQSLHVFDNRAEADDFLADAYRKYGERHCHVWEMMGAK